MPSLSDTYARLVSASPITSFLSATAARMIATQADRKIHCLSPRSWFRVTDCDTVETNVEFPPTLAAALQAVYEIRHELASLAGDENAAEIIEVLCRIVIPVSSTAARICLDAVNSYALHLSTHRYGSHVLQTILQLTPKSASAKTDLALHEDAPIVPSTDLPETSELVLGLAAELEPAATDLAIHICGSHVLRTIICLLGGVEMVSTSNKSTLHRGRVKPKHKKRRLKQRAAKRPPATSVNAWYIARGSSQTRECKTH